MCEHVGREAAVASGRRLGRLSGSAEGALPGPAARTPLAVKPPVPTGLGGGGIRLSVLVPCRDPRHTPRPTPGQEAPRGQTPTGL